MAIKERKQITGTEAQIKSYAGHNGVLAYATDTKHLHVFSGTAGTTTELANVSDIPAPVDISGKADTTYVNAELAKRAPASHTHTTAQVTGLDTALAGKAPKSHTHTIANVTNLQTALDAKASNADLSSLEADVTKDLQAVNTALAGKANTKHTHTIANVTNLQTALDAKASNATLQVDLTAIRESIANVSSKVDGIVVPKPKAYVTETHVSGTQGYRVWSDGFIEQWGKVTVSGENIDNTLTFQKPFKSTNYNIQTAGWRIADRHACVMSKTATSVTIRAWNNDNDWYAFGY